ncbi:hypothetical protein AX774_g2090 [Zancudomyces culisetae]|uniref:Uncharacterized protein n=1 Tax=Zancudomyces culisetae TaxID=1213189 RepID=A0A1R1PTV2_ZANCU|nr:hypothetical protein AX774_g2090 [Zancudomyces culisetae]|eukprot:OMH84374.1 hypothetical protein AX774_g2090 [Zancudomyces culisetae]
MPDAQRFSTQNIQNFSNYVNAVNLKTKLYALEYIKSKGSDMQSFKIVSLYDFYNAVTSQDVATALNLTLSTDSCYPVVPTAVIRQACLDSDKLAYFGATTLNTKLHALLGAAFTEAMTTNNLFISGTSLASIAQKYNVTGAGTTTNFLYGNTTAQTGTLNINEYNSTGIQENGAVLLSDENNGDIGVFDIGVNSVVTISSSSSQLYYSFTLYFSITLLALSLLGDLN